MINLPAGDYYGHRVGGPANPEVMRKIVQGCDRQLGRLIRALFNRGILDQTLIVVTGDHGMIPNTYRLDDTAIKKAVNRAGGDYLFSTGRSACYIWLRNPPAAPKVAQHLTDTIAHAPFAYYQTVESGSYIYHPVARTGTTIEPALEAAYQYLLGTFAGPYAPDIVLAFDENTIITTTSYPHGEHSGPTWGSQQVPLVIAGPGVRQGKESSFPARLMDVAPTALTLLGIEPARMDGVVLADALAAPTAAARDVQDALAPSLTAHQQAIIARSKADIAAQRRKSS
jgi:arylsulfatase A-like enzyme